TGSVVDNGQHLLMGCYAHTLAFLTRIGARARVAFQDSLRVDFLDAAGGRETLACPPLPGALSLLAGLAMFRWLTFGDRLGVLAMARDVKTRKGDADGADESADIYLQRWGQSADARRGFWVPLIFATLNEDP